MNKQVAATIVAMLTLVALTATAVMPSLGSAANENSWITKAEMNISRAYVGVESVNGKIYAIGGDQGSLIGNVIPATGMTYQVSNATEEYDPSSNAWILKSPMPTARARFAATVYQNKIYCIGGYNGANIFVGPESYNWKTEYYNVAANEAYNPLTDTWETKKPMPTPRESPATDTVDGKIYVIGGYSITTFEVQNVTEVYDPLTDTWIKATPPPLPVGSSASAVINGKIYVLGQNSTANWQNIIEVYDPETASWSVKSSAPASSSASVAATSGLNALKRIYFFDENRTDIYNPFNDNWTTGNPSPTPRPVASATVVNDLIYVIGGRTGQWGYMTFEYPSNMTEQYTPLGFGSPDIYVPPIDDNKPPADTTSPKIRIVSPETQTFKEPNVAFVFTMNETFAWAGYSLDGKENETISGNFSLINLPNGLHTLKIYANDTAGDMGVSETFSFTVAVPESEPEFFPAVPIATAVAAIVLVASAISLSLKKRKRSNK